MAGSIHSLVFTPSRTQYLPSSYRNPCIPVNPVLFTSTSSTSLRSRSSICRPIIACGPSNEVLSPQTSYRFFFLLVVCLVTRKMLWNNQFNIMRNGVLIQINGKGNRDGQALNLAERFNWTKPLLNFAGNNFLPLALISGVALGFANPSLGCLADKYSLSKFSTFGIFIISGLTLRSGDITSAAEAWPVGAFGLASILLITPYFSRIIMQIHLQPQEFVTGLAIFCCMPTTLSSGVALTQLAGGNSALALAMTVISNLLGILIVPFSIARFVAAGVGVSVPTKQLFKNLVLTLLVPLILGKVLRDSFKGLADFVDQNRKLFSKISALFLSLVPWIQVSRSRSLLLMVKPSVFLAAVAIGAVLHLTLLSFNILAVKSLSAISGSNMSTFAVKENASAVTLVASQKTLPVMVAVVEQLAGALGESGLLVLPCVAAHINQIILDSLIVNLWLQKDNSSKNIKVI